MSDLVEVMLCCNDEQGRFTGHVDSIQLGSYDSANLEYPDLDSFAMGLQFHANAIAVGDAMSPAFIAISEHRSHVGNLLWDSVKMTPAQAAELFEVARRFGFCMTAGEVALFDAWDAGKPITEALIRGAVDE